ncbi:MAG: hypothetical protein J2P59_12330 [Acidimicrobiales bacterium]|nr:hypothetical protein [Acidimicrobiales bacterium]
MNCRYCGEELPRERSTEGFDYCVKADCVERGMRPLNVVAISVNKSNDQYALREQLDIPEHAGGTLVDGGQYGIPHRPRRREPEVLSDGQKIKRMRRHLEDQLRSCTSKTERSRLIRAYNAQLRTMNIRYRRAALYREDPPVSPLDRSSH